MTLCCAKNRTSQLTFSMKNQSPTAYFPSHQLVIIPYNQNILHQNNNNEPPKPHNTTRIKPLFRQNKFSNLLEEFHSHYTTQELLTAAFVRIMSITSFSHLVLGFQLLDKTGLSSSISPLLMSLFKYSMAILTSFSLVSAGDQYSKLFKAPIRKKTLIFTMYVLLPIAHFLSQITEKYKRIFYYMVGLSYMACVGDFSTGLGKHVWFLNFGLYWFMQTTIMLPITVRVDASSDMVLIVTGLTTTFWAAENSLDLLTSSTPSLHCFLDKSIQKFLPLATTRVKFALKKKKIWKLVKYAISLVGTLIFQNYVRLTTFGHVKAFMYLATSWLANLTFINASDDFGILNFLLGNVILGSTVSQYGLKITTWFIYGVCLFLYILGIKLKSINTSENLERLPRPPFLFWIFYCCVVFDSLYSLFHHQI